MSNTQKQSAEDGLRGVGSGGGFSVPQLTTQMETLNIAFLINAPLLLFLVADFIAYRAALRWKFRRGISWDEWEAHRWRFLPGGGFYMLRKYRLPLNIKT